jgi:hypothetical protein
MSASKDTLSGGGMSASKDTLSGGGMSFPLGPNY